MTILTTPAGRRLAPLLIYAALLPGVPIAAAPAAAQGVRPGISVLLTDSVRLVRGKRVALLTNQSGVDERGVSDIDRLTDAAARAAGVRLVALFAPEHGIRGTEDRTNLAGGVDEKSGVVVHSLYGRTTTAPPDSTLLGVDVLLVDLQDLGARPWTFPASMVYTLRAAARNRVPILVLDRPNPITGTHVEGPIVDSALTNGDDDTPARHATPTSIFPIPLRHGLTMGELARFYNDVLRIGAQLTVVPAAGWRRSQWFDRTGLPWVRPSPNMPSVTSATFYPGMVILETTNLSVGRGTDSTFQRFGAPWMGSAAVAARLTALGLPGVRFGTETFTPVKPGDSKYNGREVAGVRMWLTDREAFDATLTAAAVVWAVGREHPDSLKVRDVGFDRTFGGVGLREALLRGDDPRRVLARTRDEIAAFRRRVAPYLIYP
ncbi:MAG: DUF1343 domain-containing protein [Gemmatimonadetes bacterium]|nr:DUF1343 domain-containing protein [Gemmatimonadota bacterium]